MRWLLRLVCQHNKVQIRRAHRDVCLAHHGKEGWIDVHGVYTFFVCGNCGQVLQSGRRHREFDVYPPKETT